jgi:hypothetical protein
MFSLKLFAYGSWETRPLMFATCCCAMRPRPSVKGTVKTSGSVPPARSAVNVVAVQVYSWDLTVMSGFAFSNSAARASNWAFASLLRPLSIATVMVTGPLRVAAAVGLGLSSAAPLSPPLQAASAPSPSTLSPSVTAVRLLIDDFIVSP